MKIPMRRRPPPVGGQETKGGRLRRRISRDDVLIQNPSRPIPGPSPLKGESEPCANLHSVFNNPMPTTSTANIPCYGENLDILKGRIADMNPPANQGPLKL
jgi:hypothetical protein